MSMIVLTMSLYILMINTLICYTWLLINFLISSLFSSSQKQNKLMAMQTTKVTLDIKEEGNRDNYRF